MKTLFIVLTHQSECFRPFGFEALKGFVCSLKNSMRTPYNLLIIDNESDGDVVEKFATETDNVIYHRINDQKKTGITGAWNIGLKMAIQAGYEMIFVANDDIKFNDSIFDLLYAIENDLDKNSTVYGVLSNQTKYPKQHSLCKISNEFVELSGMDWNETIYAFFFGFTDKFYHRFKDNDGNLFKYENKYISTNGKWCGQEGMFRVWQDQGAKQKIFNGCWVEHIGSRTWLICSFADELSNNSLDVLKLLKDNPEKSIMLQDQLNRIFKSSNENRILANNK